jgi:hypothetical protein
LECDEVFPSVKKSFDILENSSTCIIRLLKFSVNFKINKLFLGCKIQSHIGCFVYFVDINLFNPLTAELNSICHLLILLGDLTFMSKSIVSISNKMQHYTVYLYLETALNVSGGTSTHHQERVQLYLQHLVFVTPLLISDAIVEELEPV